MLVVPTYLGLSEINGIGVFAKEDIAEGELIWEYVEGFDREITGEEIQALPKAAQEYLDHFSNLVEPNERYLMSRPKPRALYLLCGDNARFMNHHHEPNLLAVGDRNCALRKISRGEELTCDYRKFDIGSSTFF
mgnify:CR=1 FL=1